MEIKRTTEWAKELNLPVKLLRRAAAKGQLQVMQLGRGANSPYYATRESVEAWIESRKLKRRAW